MSELTLSKYSIGSDIHTSAMSFAAGAPLDDRFVVVSKESLISESVFSKFAYLYSGLVVTVANTGEAYVLKTDTTNSANNFLKSDEYLKTATDTMIQQIIDENWTKLASNKDLQDIKNVVSGIFQFKGVASAIDPDHTTLTIGNATVSGSTIVGANKINFSGKLLISYGTVLQENLDSVKYAWGTSEYPNLFFTDKLYTTKDDEGQAQYERGAENELQYINVFDTLYFYKPNQDETVNYTIPSQGAGGSPTTGTRIYKVWEALDKGGILYSLPSEKVNKTLDVYTVTSTAELPTALKTGVPISTYNYYQFTEIADASKYTVKINNSANAVTSVTASPENNGHVYQIGEEEYASNGNMWVQLGSPKTDWIVL